MSRLMRLGPDGVPKIVQSITWVYAYCWLEVEYFDGTRSEVEVPLATNFGLLTRHLTDEQYIDAEWMAEKMYQRRAERIRMLCDS